MTTENTSAVVALYSDVASYFGASGVSNIGVPPAGSSIVFGRRERWKQINEGTGGANRVVLIPGRLDGTDGELVGPDGPGSVIEDDRSSTPRPLFQQPKIVTFSIWAADTTNDPATNDEAQQQQIVEQLFEYVVRAVKNSPVGGVSTWRACRYNANPNERRFGLEYLAELELDSQILDVVRAVAFPGKAAVNRSHQ